LPDRRELPSIFSIKKPDGRQRSIKEKASQSFSRRNAKKQFDPFFSGTPSRGASLAAAQQFTFCASKKTLLSPEVCERLSARVRALDCLPSGDEAFGFAASKKA